MQLVIAAITTWPLSSSVRVPSASVSGTVVCRAPFATWVATGSLAGNESASDSSSSVIVGRKSLTATSNASFARSRGTRSCGRRGPAMLGSTVLRSSSSVSLKVGSSESLVVPQPLLPGVALDQRDLLGGRPLNSR